MAKGSGASGGKITNDQAQAILEDPIDRKDSLGKAKIAVQDPALDYFVDEDVITSSERDKILKVWIGFAKKNLPAAQYANEQI